jgi:hypothetical protein
VHIDDEGFPFLDEAILIGSPHEDDIPHIHVGPPNTSPHTSNGPTSNHTSFIKSSLTRNLILHYFATLISTSLFSQPNG